MTLPIVASGTHVDRHKTGGQDPIAPGDIGAVTTAQLASEATTRAANDAALQTLIGGLSATAWQANVAYPAEKIVSNGVGLYEAPTGGVPSRSTFTAGDWIHLADIALPVGTGPGTVMAGNDGRVTGIPATYAPLASPALTGAPTVNGLPIGSGTGLTPTVVKTGAYTAAVGEWVATDATAGTVPIALPSAPVDKAVIGGKMITTASGHSTTITCGGTDTFNKAGGSTVLTLSLTGQGFQAQYNASLKVWYIQADDLPLAQLDARYQATALALLKANNLSDLASSAAALQHLGIGLTPFVGGGQTGPLGLDPIGPVPLWTNTTGNNYNQYPGDCLCPDGSVLITCRSATSDGVQTDAIMARRAAGPGLPFGAPWTLYTPPAGYDARGCSLTTLSDNQTVVLALRLEPIAGAPVGSLSYTMNSTDNGNTFGSLVPLNTGFTSFDAIANPVCDLLNGTVIAAYYGQNAGDTFDSCGVVISTDKCQSWHSPTIVANGQTDSASYAEPFVLLKQFGVGAGTLMMAIRNLTTVHYQKATSTAAAPTTWSSPTSTLFYPNSVDGAPDLCETNSGSLTLSFRTSTTQRFVTSWDNGSTWSGSVTLPVGTTGTPNQGRYSAMCQISPNQIGIAYSMNFTSPNYSALYFGVLYDGFGTTALGTPVPEPRTSDININVFAYPLQTNWVLSGPNSELYAFDITTDNTQGRTWTKTVTLEKGTWSFYFQHVTAAQYGIATVTLDGVTIGTFDCYSASGAFNVVSPITGVSVPLSGKHVLTLTYATKNASGTGYVGSLSQINGVRTDSAV